MVHSINSIITCPCGAALQYDDEEVRLGPISFVGEKALYIVCPDCGRMVPVGVAL